MNFRKICIKTISFLLTAVIFMPSFVIEVNSAMTASQACIDIIKKFEGFSQYKYWDYKQWTIGYGTGVAADEYPDGISEQEAEILLKKSLGTYEGYVNKFTDKYNITLKQNQFDALVSLSYNMGNIWSVYDDFDLKNYIIDGSENHSYLEITKGFGEWRKAGGEVLQGLVNRRADETALFLSDRTNASSEIWRVNTEGGINLRSAAGSNNQKTGFLPMNTIYEITEKKTVDNTLWGKTYIDGKEHWCVLEYSKYIVGGPIDYEGGNLPSSPSEKSEKWSVISPNGVNLRGGPGIEYESLAILESGTEFTVTETVESEEHIWGKTKYNDKSGWIALTYAERVSEQKFQTVVLENVYIASKPTKTEYKEGEMLDLHGIEVRAEYSDGSQKTITDFTVDGFESVAGAHEITVTYMEKTAKFVVNVKEKKLEKLEIEHLPDKVIYREDEEFEDDGLVIKAIYDNNAEKIVTDYDIDGYDGTPGTKKIVVTYDNMETSFEVEVTEKKMIKLMVTSLPQKREYVIGQRLDLTGMKVYAFFDNNSHELVTKYSVTGYNPQKLGTQKVVIGYNDFYTNIEVRVKEPDIYEMPGDVNDNQTRDIFDLILLNKFVFEGRIEFPADRIHLADVNGDGNYDETDIEALSRIVSEQ